MTSTQANLFDFNAKAPVAPPAAPLRKRWIQRQTHLGINDLELERKVKQITNNEISPLLAKLMILRGQQTPETAQAYLHGGLGHLPDPFSMLGMASATQRILRCLQEGKVPVISSDYDSDGISCTATLVSFFNMIHVDVPYFSPHREKDGYGLSADMIRKMAEDGHDLLITADCGTSAHAEIALANSLGIDVIVTDHHQPSEQLPPAYAILNPHQDGCEFPDKNLCGVGVVFFLTIALRKLLRDLNTFSEDLPEPDLRELLPFVALGTVCDVVPLVGVNRILVQTGLYMMANRSWPGLAALTSVSGVKHLTAGSLGYYLGPRLNASGRLDTANIGVQLLLAKDQTQADHLANSLHLLNKERQEIEEKVFKKAISRIEAGECQGRTIVLADKDFHAGVQGICASKIVDIFHKPTILIAIDGNKGKASGRSIKGFNLFEGLQQCHHLLEKFGGHEYAAGLSINIGNISTFAESFEAVAQSVLREEDMIPKAIYDIEVPFQEITLSLIESLERLAPYGIGNPSPVFIARNVDVINSQVLKDKHLKFTALQNGNKIEAIAFNMADQIEELLKGPIDLLFQPGINEWKGHRTVQLDVKDYRN